MTSPAMRKKTFYLTDHQISQLELLASLLPGSPDVSGLVRDGVDLICEKYFSEEIVKKALAERTKKEKVGRVRRIRPLR